MSRTFRDKTGDTWTLTIDVPTITRVREASDGQFDLRDVEGVFYRTSGYDDLPAFFELLAYLVYPQIVERGIDGEEFGKRMAHRYGLHLLNARGVFYLALADFFPSTNPHKDLLVKAEAWQRRQLMQVAEIARKAKQHGRR